jgi:hypothetical protein
VLGRLGAHAPPRFSSLATRPIQRRIRASFRAGRRKHC